MRPGVDKGRIGIIIRGAETNKRGRVVVDFSHSLLRAKVTGAAKEELDAIE